MIAFRLSSPGALIGQEELRLMNMAVAKIAHEKGYGGLPTDLHDRLRAAGIIVVVQPFRSDAA